MAITRKSPAVLVSDKRLYADKDGKVVDEKDPNKRTLIVAAGGELSQGMATRFGLVPDAESGTAAATPAAAAGGTRDKVEPLTGPGTGGEAGTRQRTKADK